jgi:hypothetical protein
MFPAIAMAGLAGGGSEEATKVGCRVGMYEIVPTAKTTLLFKGGFNNNAMR